MSQLLLVFLMLFATMVIAFVIILVNARSHVRKRKKAWRYNGHYEPVKLCATKSINLKIPYENEMIDGLEIQPNDRILLSKQDNPYENGIWTVNPHSSWVRTKDLSREEDIIIGSMIYVTEGETYANQTMILQVVDKKQGKLDENEIAAALYFDTWMNMVVGDDQRVPGSSLIISDEGMPKWVAPVKNMPVLGTQERLDEHITLVPSSMVLHDLECLRPWIHENHEGIWILYVTLKHGGLLSVFRYEFMISSLTDLPRVQILRNDTLSSTGSKKKGAVSVSVVTPEGGWWSEQTTRNITLSLENHTENTISANIRLLQVVNAVDECKFY